MRLRAIAIVCVPILALGVGASFLYKARADRIEMGRQPDGSHLVSTGQRLTPYGTLVRIEGARPKGLALSPDRSMVAALCNGRVAIFRTSGEPVAEVAMGTGALGIAWARNGAIYASTDRGGVNRIEQRGEAWRVVSHFNVLPPDEERIPMRSGNPQALGIALSQDETEIFVALGRWNYVARARLPEGEGASPKLLPGFVTDVAPYSIVTARGFVVSANRGGAPPGAEEQQAETSGTPVAVDTETDAALRGSLTVWSSAFETAYSVAVGRQPSGMALSPDGERLAVANSDSDTVSIVHVRSGRVLSTTSLWPEEEQVFGHLPTDVAWSDDGKTLYVTCGGINAVAVLDYRGEPRLIGHIPTAWFPIAIEQSQGMLIVACAKGFGSRHAAKNTRFGVHDNVGVLQFIQTREALEGLNALSERVASNNGWGRELPPRRGRAPVPVPERVGEPSVFRHVVYIIKENLTYDALLGALEKGNGDPSLCMFPEEVAPNHYALAREFVLLDNTYTSGTNSADGHQWTSSSLANAYIEQNYAAHVRSYPYDGGDALAFSPKGFLWTAAMRRGISVRVYGEFVDKPVVAERGTGRRPSFKELWDEYRAGGDRFEIRAETSQAALRKVLHPRFIGFPSIVSDQWRADQFLAELRQWERVGDMPALCILLFPNDHTSGTTPGMPTPRAAVADNDLALGRVVEAISHSRFWKDTLILVIEDDSQLGLDHVDGHRTVAYCISPYTKRGEVVSEPYNHTSFVRTMGLVLGFPALNRFDRAATPLAACFASRPDLTPYVHRSNRVPLDELNPPVTELEGPARELAIASQRLDWSDVDLADATTVARAVWSVTRPGEPFPWSSFRPNRDAD